MNLPWEPSCGTTGKSQRPTPHRVYVRVHWNANICGCGGIRSSLFGIESAYQSVDSVD